MSNLSLHTTIENLSTELWCEIFSFFDAIELYQSFDNINHRITAILSESTPLYFKIATTKDYEFAYDVILPKVNNYATVRSFKFYKEFQIEDFFTLWPLNTFSQLRCLYLIYSGALMSDCSIALIEKLSTLTSFESLHFRVGRIAYHDICLMRLIQLIFIADHGFLSLKQFVYQCDTDSDVLHIPAATKKTILEFITLPSFCFTNLLQILPSIPHIKFIKANRLISDYDETPPVALSSSNFILSNGVDLRLHLDYHITFEEIELLLQQVSYLNQLKLTCDCNLFDGNKWEALLAKNCTKLQKFEIIFSPQARFLYLPSLDELQDSFSTMFWVKRNVQCEHRVKLCRSIVRFKI